MTHRKIKVLEDGTRVYADYHRYTPKPEAERVYQRRKPDDPRAVRFGTEWLLPLDLAPEGARVMPETRPDTDAYEHAGIRGGCRCEPCRRPTAARWQARWRREQDRATVPVRP